MKETIRKQLEKKFAEGYSNWRKKEAIKKLMSKTCTGKQFAEAMKIIKVNPDEICTIDEWCLRLSATIEGGVLADEWWVEVFQQAKEIIDQKQKPIYVRELAEIVCYKGSLRHFAKVMSENCKANQMRCFRTENGLALDVTG